MPKKTARAIVRHGGDYLIALKDNQPRLHQHARDLLPTRPYDLVGQIECEHGRIEQRNLRLAPFDPALADFPHARQMLSCTRRYPPKNGGETKTETRHFITRLAAGERTPEQLARLIRGHWSVENRNHGKRDASFWREDRAPKRSARGAKNLALLRSALLALIPGEPFDSLDAAFDHYRDHRGQALRLVPNARPFPECPPASQSP